MNSDFPLHSIGDNLAVGEKLLWQGKPATGIRFQESDRVLIPFSIVWCGFAICWEGMTLRIPNNPTLPMGGAIFFSLWGIPFVLIGLYMVFGRFITDARRRARTEYVLTDRRALVIECKEGRKITSVPLGTVQTKLTLRNDGTGTIVFGAMGIHPYVYGGRTNAPAFEIINDAGHVYQLIQQRD